MDVNAVFYCEKNDKEIQELESFSRKFERVTIDKELIGNENGQSHILLKALETNHMASHRNINIRDV